MCAHRAKESLNRIKFAKKITHLFVFQNKYNNRWLLFGLLLWCAFRSLRHGCGIWSGVEVIESSCAEFDTLTILALKCKMNTDILATPLENDLIFGLLQFACRQSIKKRDVENRCAYSNARSIWCYAITHSRRTNGEKKLLLI